MAGTLQQLGQFLFLFPLLLPLLLLLFKHNLRKNDLISQLYFPDLQNRANFAYLKGAGKGLMLAKEFKLAQKQDATDAQDDNSRPFL